MRFDETKENRVETPDTSSRSEAGGEGFGCGPQREDRKAETQEAQEPLNLVVTAARFAWAVAVIKRELEIASDTDVPTGVAVISLRHVVEALRGTLPQQVLRDCQLPKVLSDLDKDGVELLTFGLYVAD